MGWANAHAAVRALKEAHHDIEWAREAETVFLQSNPEIDELEKLRVHYRRLQLELSVVKRARALA